MITVKKVDENTFEVTVKESTITTHQVRLSDEYFNQLTGGSVSKETLIEKSFEFLLEREDNTMILKSFDLPVIQGYFSNYEKDIREKISV